MEFLVIFPVYPAPSVFRNRKLKYDESIRREEILQQFMYMSRYDNYFIDSMQEESSRATTLPHNETFLIFPTCGGS
jgi:hypothetical protein